METESAGAGGEGGVREGSSPAWRGPHHSSESLFPLQSLLTTKLCVPSFALSLDAKLLEAK